MKLVCSGLTVTIAIEVLFAHLCGGSKWSAFLFSVPQETVDVEIREAFLRFHATILGQYRCGVG